jgi:nitrate reductase NapD
MPESEYHVASYVVRTRPEDAAWIAEQINCVPGLEVHASEQGKLIVTAEAESTRQLAELGGALELMDAVLQVSPVYHEFTQEQAPEQAATTSASKNTRNQIQ